MQKLEFKSILSILIGIVIFNQFIVLCVGKFFSLAGYQDRLTHLYKTNFLSISKTIIKFFLDGASFFHLFFPIVLLITALCLICGFFRRYANWLALIIFLFYFIAHIGPENWLFTYIMPLVFSYLLVQDIKNETRSPYFAFDFQGLNALRTICLFLLISIFIYWINVASKNALNPTLAAILTALLVFLFLLVNYAISNLSRLKKIASDALKEQLLIDKMTIVLGMMLVSQVHMDRLLDWFTRRGYVGLINIYQKYSSIAHKAFFFTNFTKQHVTLMLPLQASLEPFLSLCLILLVFRPIAFLLTALLFLALSFIEFGVPATYPVQYPVQYTWTWELLLSGVVMLIVTFYEFKRFHYAKGFYVKWFGHAVFPYMSILKRCYYTILVSILLFIVITISHNLTQVSFIFSFGSSLSVFFYLSLFHLIDHLKSQYLDKAQLNFADGA